ncbi:hypothetical protein [Rhizobium sp. Root1204]|uniref:hypothetical protein n=1 Tax=Rhizobium sp. Root1204 TaxID=1736428 RepID=UPI0007139FE6|nr:hypothetical protein [Rhizobium sp. Root1204]KQV36369.1 hypothetical protein ASC96_28290 [Rhizobium sp. Root1204]
MFQVSCFQRLLTILSRTRTDLQYFNANENFDEGCAGREQFFAREFDGISVSDASAPNAEEQSNLIGYALQAVADEFSLAAAKVGLPENLLENWSCNDLEMALSPTGYFLVLRPRDYRNAQSIDDLTISEVLRDPLIRLLNIADGIETATFANLLETASNALAGRDNPQPDANRTGKHPVFQPVALQSAEHAMSSPLGAPSCR